MNLIIKKETDEILYTFSEEVVIYKKYIYIATEPLSLRITDLNEDNAKLEVTELDLPVDWEPEKYIWENEDFVLNPNYVDPEE